jgi:hypothetical protein
MVQMAPLEMEERLTALEREMARLRSKVEEMGTADRPWWEVIADSFVGDPAHEEAANLGRA